jgi:hypothetical protein
MNFSEKLVHCPLPLPNEEKIQNMVKKSIEREFNEHKETDTEKNMRSVTGKNP